MSIDTLLGRLEKVRATGNDQWVARCPAHEDLSPSLSIKDCGDGRILMHCFAGCETASVLEAIGLIFSDLMPEPVGHHQPATRSTRFNLRTLLEAVAHEALVAAILAEDMAYRGESSLSQRDRLWEAARALGEARDAAR